MNQGVQPPLQDVVKQVIVPLPVISINPRARMITEDSSYDFKLDPDTSQVLKSGAGLQFSLFANSADLGEDVTIKGLRLLNEMRFCLTRDQVEGIERLRCS
jgi:hypothetical protein